LKLFRMFLYRPLMRLIHYFGLHWMEKIGPMEDYTVFKWCKWCGLRTKPRPYHAGDDW